MVFSSHLFLFVFMPLALALYFATPERGRNLTLTLTSFVFYGWTNPAFIVLLLFSTFVDWYAGLVQGTNRWWPFGVEPPRAQVGGPAPARSARRCSPRSSATSSLLAFFKYFDFSVDSWNAAVAASACGRGDDRDHARPSPCRSASASTPSSRSPTRSTSSAATPAASAASSTSPASSRCSRSWSRGRSSASPRSPTRSAGARSRSSGSRAASPSSRVGLAKKVLLANPCGKIADTVFDAASSSALDAWYGLVAYSFQIYYDFSGYSDMAIGLGLHDRLRLPEELRLALPLALGDRVLAALAPVALDLAARLPLHPARRQPQGAAPRPTSTSLRSMLLGGLWHGASWNFVALGRAARRAAHARARGGPRTPLGLAARAACAPPSSSDS